MSCWDVMTDGTSFGLVLEFIKYLKSQARSVLR